MGIPASKTSVYLAEEKKLEEVCQELATKHQLLVTKAMITLEFIYGSPYEWLYLFRDKSGRMAAEIKVISTFGRDEDHYYALTGISRLLMHLYRGLSYKEHQSEPCYEGNKQEFITNFIKLYFGVESWEKATPEERGEIESRLLVFNIGEELIK